MTDERSQLVYRLTPTLGLALSNPEITLIDEDDDKMRFRVDMQAVMVERADEDSPWEPVQ